MRDGVTELSRARQKSFVLLSVQPECDSLEEDFEYLDADPAIFSTGQSADHYVSGAAERALES
jgi:hypothetical protein